MGSWWLPRRNLTECPHVSTTRKASGARPFTARSVVASTLLGARPPVLSARVLVRSGALFGISEGTVRVALTRMVAAGELATDGEGRYELVGRLRTRQREQDESRRWVDPGGWDGGWELHVVRPERRDAAERAALRAAAGRLRLVEARDGTWTRPANLDARRRPDDRRLVAAAVTSFTARPDEPDALARALWDLDAWAGDARVLVERIRAAGAELGRRGDLGDGRLAAAFVLEADVLRHLHHDPLLPSELLAARWPGPTLRARFEEFDARFLAAWRQWLRH